MRALAGGAALSLGLALGGCASFHQVTAEVSNHGQWPAGRAQTRYVFERLPSQQDQAELQTRIENAAAPALAMHGFVPVAQASQADVLVQVGMQMRVVPAVYDAPYYRPFDGRFFGGAFSVGGIWGSRGGLGIGVMVEPPRSQMQVDMLMRDRLSGQTVYELHAVHQRVGVAFEGLMPALFRAALTDFPAQGASTRRVTVELDAAAAKAPAPAASSASAAQP
jgi:Domain of unknown function (DUF4136)